MSTCYRFPSRSVFCGSVLARLILASALLAPPLLVPESALAGVELRSQTTHYNQDPPRVESTLTRAHNGNLRIDISDTEASDVRLSTISRGAFGDFLIVDHGEEAFTLLDEAAIEDLEARLQFTMLQLDKKMAELPPEQRRRMREALASQEAEPEPDLVETDRRQEIEGLDCRLFEFRRGEVLVREVWVASWDQVAEGAELKKSLENLQGFSQRLEQAFASVRSEALGGAQIFDLGDNPFKDFERFGGLPVLTVEFEGGKKSFETKVETIEARPLTQRDFLPPESFRQRAWGSQ